VRCPSRDRASACAVDLYLVLCEQRAHGVELAEQAAQLQTLGLFDLLGVAHVLDRQEFAQPSRRRRSHLGNQPCAQQRGERRSVNAAAS